MSKEPWDLTEVIRNKHRINKNIPGLGPQNMFCSHLISAADMACYLITGACANEILNSFI